MSAYMRPIMIPFVTRTRVNGQSTSSMRELQRGGRRGLSRRLDVVDGDGRGERRLAPVLVRHLRGELDAADAAVEGVDDGGVFLADEAAPHLARPGDLGVVGV